MKTLLVSSFQGGQRLVLLSEPKMQPEAFFYDISKPLACLDSLFYGQVIHVRSHFALIDIGLERPSFLPLQCSSVTQGQRLLVQVTREEMEDLGERCKDLAFTKAVQVTPHVTLSRRYIHFHPFKAALGFSKGLAPEAVERLCNEFQGLQYVTFRSAAHDAPFSLIEAEIDEVREHYKTLKEKLKKVGLIQPGPTALEKQIRDIPILKVIAEDWEKRAQIKPYLGSEQEIEVIPRPFDAFGIEDIWESLLHPTVPIEDKAALLFETSSGLTIIDVNGGDHDPGLINLKSIPILAQHLCWRNISGNILIDFIPMRNVSFRHKILQSLKNSLMGYGFNILGWSALGPLQLRRSLRTQPLWMKLSKPCHSCLGTGRLI